MSRPPSPSISFASLALTTATVAIMWMACGGTAVIDGSSSGGAGGTSSNNNSSNNNNSSSSSGQACSCSTACSYLESCGFFGPECLTICNQGTDPAFIACVCGSQGNCGAISACGIGSTGTSVAVSSGSGGGGPITPQCISCAQGQFDNDLCLAEANQCDNNPQCNLVLECASNCNFGSGCIQNCEMQFPGGVPSSSALMSCLLCGACFSPCSTSFAAFHYCLP